jgi:hypothetical protein
MHKCELITALQVLEHAVVHHSQLTQPWLDCSPTWVGPGWGVEEVVGWPAWVVEVKGALAMGALVKGVWVKGAWVMVVEAMAPAAALVAGQRLGTLSAAPWQVGAPCEEGVLEEAWGTLLAAASAECSTAWLTLLAGAASASAQCWTVSAWVSLAGASCR